MSWSSIRDFLRLFPAATRRSFGWALAVSVVLSALDLAALVLLYPVFGALVSGGRPTMPVLGGLLAHVGETTLVVVNVVLMLARSLAGLGFRFWWGSRVADAEVALSSRLLAAYAYAPYTFHLRRNSSDLLARCVNYVNMASFYGLNGLMLLAADLTTVAAVCGALFLANPGAATVVCGYLTLVGLAMLLIGRRFVAAQAARYTEAVGHVYHRTTTVFRGIRELTAAGGRDAALRSVETSRRAMTRAQRVMAVLTDVPRLILEIALYAALLVGLLTVLGGHDPAASLPVAALYIVAGLRMLPALARALGNLTNARTGIEIAGRVGAELRDLAITGPPPPRAGDHLPRRATLSLDAVSFRYDTGPAVLDDIDLDIPFGSYLAVVGSSGAGKSTLLGLMLGLLSPTAGRVSYGGVSVGVGDSRWLRQVAYVPQEVFILDDTVLANVALGDVTVDADRAWTALEQACLADFVGGLAEGLATPLGEAGSRLSAGQRQRLGLARALYREPAVLILDEPTASLDRDTEEQVMRTVEALSGTITIVIVTHRLDTIARAGVTLRLDRGQLSSAVGAPPRSRGPLEEAL